MLIKLKKIFKYLLLIILLVSIDQLSKSYLISYLKIQAGMTYKLTYFLSLVYAWNYGISFGLFSNYYQYSNYIFLAINSVIIMYIFSQLFGNKSRLQSTGFAIIIGGAIGNIIDRIFRGAVFDFLYFHYKDYSFPAFNLADAFINIGVVLVIISFFRKH